jgi:aryl-alcohol dehydrogenase-like predicted oxidoreductase/Pyruvate/2-oxoacid:ferredoxin oxidoreductase delta subunit
MIYRQLGRTGLIVSHLCMGVLTIGPLQSNLPLEEGADVLAYALRRGINFFDTAQSYKTYPYIRKAIKDTGIRPVISSKSYDYTYQGMKDSVEEALDEMGISYLDLFMLHEQESLLTIKGHREALTYLVQARDKGILKAVGMSTHSIKGVWAGIQTPEIEVIHPLVNRRGLGIMDGSRDEMLAVICVAHNCGKGIYGMKALGGGNLNREAWESFRFIADNDYIDSMAVGMKSRDEVDLNLNWIEGHRNPELEKRVGEQERHLHIEEWCQACGTCILHCRYDALSIVDDILQVDASKCIMCGYCAQYCEDFCIKMV